jgi:hypothetical protein
MTQLRLLFRKRTEFRVAREFMAWFIVKGKLPSNRRTTQLGKLMSGVVASCRDDVLERGGDVIGVTVRRA